MPKRLILFFLKDDEIITSSLIYTLKSLSEIGSEIVIIGKNIPLELSDYKNFKNLSDYKTYDAFEQIVIANSSFYGPFNSFDNIFDKMSGFDFWSLDELFLSTKSFLVFNSSFAKNDTFVRFIDSNNFVEDFIQQGFTLGLYSDDINNIHKNIENYSYPIIHKEYFYKTNQKSFNYRLKFAFDYIKNVLKFDVDLIIDDLIKNKKANLIIKNLHLNYILPSAFAKETTAQDKVALIMFIHPESLIEECRSYANIIPEDINIFVVSTNENVLDKCKVSFDTLKNKIEYRLQPNRGRDNTALLITCADVIKDYDYICFTHAKLSNHLKQKVSSDDFRNHCFKSLLYSKEFILNVISTFKNNKYLGILAPFPPNFQPFVAIGDEWGKNLNNASSFIKNRLNIDIPLSEEDPICTFGDMFWFKGKALNTLNKANLSFEDFPEEPLTDYDGLLTHSIERIIPALAQIDGFYTSYVASVEYATIYLDNVMNDFKLIRKDFLKKNNVN